MLHSTIIALVVWFVAAPSVSTALSAVTEAQIHRAAQDYVRDQLKDKVDEGERVEVNIRWQGDVALEGEGKPVVLIRRLSGRPLRGPTVLRAELHLGGRTVRVMSLTADVRFFRPVVIAGRNIRRGEPLTADAFEVAERDITRQRHGFFAATDELEGLQARRPVSFGSVLSRDHVQSVPVVQRGDQLSMVLDGGNMQLSASATALQAGGVGDRIRVRNADSGKILQGWVADARTVEIR
jgi:flagella basal body P-ring formation protein FlgA